MATEPYLWKCFIMNLSLVWNNVRITQANLNLRNSPEEPKGPLITKASFAMCRVAEFPGTLSNCPTPPCFKQHFSRNQTISSIRLFCVRLSWLLRINAMPETGEFSTNQLQDLINLPKGSIAGRTLSSNKAQHTEHHPLVSSLEMRSSRP